MNNYKKNTFEWWLVEKFKRLNKVNETDEIYLQEYVNISEIDLFVNGEKKAYFLKWNELKKFNKWKNKNKEKEIENNKKEIWEKAQKELEKIESKCDCCKLKTKEYVYIKKGYEYSEFWDDWGCVYFVMCKKCFFKGEQ